MRRWTGAWRCQHRGCEVTSEAVSKASRVPATLCTAWLGRPVGWACVCASSELGCSGASWAWELCSYCNTEPKILHPAWHCSQTCIGLICVEPSLYYQWSKEEWGVTVMKMITVPNVRNCRLLMWLRSLCINLVERLEMLDINTILDCFKAFYLCWRSIIGPEGKWECGREPHSSLEVCI